MNWIKKEKIIDKLIFISWILATAFLIISSIRDYYLHGFMYVLKHDIIIFLWEFVVVELYAF